jgi:DNA-binding transcriptional ArsR family regulator
MSRKNLSSGPAKRRNHAIVFAALGHATRLGLVAKLCRGEQRSISGLTQGTQLTRQAITKHLRVLEDAGLVHRIPAGRESLFRFDPEPIAKASDYLAFVSEQWDQALSRLKAFLERGTRA